MTTLRSSSVVLALVVAAGGSETTETPIATTVWVPASDTMQATMVTLQGGCM